MSDKEITKSASEGVIWLKKHIGVLDGKGHIDHDDFHYSIMDKEARKIATPKLNEKGFTVKEIAEIEGVSERTVRNELFRNKMENIPKNREEKSTRALLAQSDQNDWRTPRKFLDAAREGLADA